MAEQVGAPSTRSAAVLLLALGEGEAATVLKHLDAKVVQRLGVEMAQLKSASREEVSAVISGFVNVMDAQADIKVGSDDYIRKVLINALGGNKLRLVTHLDVSRADCVRAANVLVGLLGG